MFSFLTNGGPFMFAILGVSIFGGALIVERWFALLRLRMIPHGDLDKVSALSRQGEYKKAMFMCAKSRHPIMGILQSALSSVPYGEEAVESMIYMESQKATPKIQKRTGYLNMLANVATLLGLLGTITGLIQAFKGVGLAEAAAKQEVLAQGISVAMNTTAFGLIVAVPCLITYHWLTNKEERILQIFEEKTMEFLHIFKYEGPKERPMPAKKLGQVLPLNHGSLDVRDGRTG